MLPFNALFALVKEAATHSDAVADETCTPKAVKIHSLDILSVCRQMNEDPSAFFDMLSCLTAIDNGPEAGTMEVIYNLYSIPFDHHLAVKVVLSRDNPEVDSIQEIWKTANWHEREAYDLFGIKFRGHPDLRRILLPADWEGFPLRKDYKHQEYYRDIKVEY
jgi:NADH-quinone oxidoreductase subunit C